MTPIGFTLTEEDMLAATKLGTLATYRKNYGKIILMLFVVTLVISGGISAFDWDGWLGFAKLFGLLLATYAVLMLVAFALVWAFFIKWRVRKSMRQIAALSREQYLTWTQTGFEIESSQGNSLFPYDEIHQWAVNDTSLILYPADYLFFVFPRRIFESEAQASEFLAALEACPAKRI